MASHLLRPAVVGVTLAASCLASHPRPLDGQLSDAFAAHFGASRTRERGTLTAASIGLLLLTQYGSRWKEPPFSQDTITDYDQLATTVGYNYLTGGIQKSWLLTSPCKCTLVVGASAVLGVTSDRLTRAGQDALHNYLRYPHVRRGNVDSGDWIAGSDLDASLWYSLLRGLVSIDLFVNGAFTYATHHGEQHVGLGFDAGAWLLRLQGSVQKAMWVDQSVVPAAVANRLKSDYWKASGLITLDRTKYFALRNVLPTGGGGITYSTGLFPGERELLLSVFLEFPGGPNDTWRIEFVNDALNDKDRGPTGGLRVVYVAR